MKSNVGQSFVVGVVVVVAVLGVVSSKVREYPGHVKWTHFSELLWRMVDELVCFLCLSFAGPSLSLPLCAASAIKDMMIASGKHKGHRGITRKSR